MYITGSEKNRERVFGRRVVQALTDRVMEEPCSKTCRRAPRPWAQGRTAQVELLRGVHSLFRFIPGPEIEGPGEMGPDVRNRPAFL